MTDTIKGSAEVALPVPPRLHLLPHQREGIAFAVNRLRMHRGAMFGDVMGVGKTIEAIGTANVLGPRRILVACPASVLSVRLKTCGVIGIICVSKEVV
jgi:SNF2 family DNA or RNA helicase